MEGHGDAAGLSRQGRGCSAQQQRSELAAGPGSQKAAAECWYGHDSSTRGAAEQQCSFCQGSYFKPAALWVALLAPRSV